nr:hypothetical protein [Tanacetum cinerariifolium]
MSERIDTQRRIKKMFKEQDHHFLGLGCDNIETDRTVRNVMSDLSRVNKLVKGLSDRFDEYERSKVFDAKRVLEKELSEGSFPLPLGSQVREPPAEPSARPVPFPYPDDPYVVTRDAAIADAAIATSDIDDDDDTTPIDSQPHEPHGSPRDTQTMPPRKSTRGNPPPPLTQDTINSMIQENFMKCSPITFHGNEGAVGLIRWIEKTEMVFTVSKCTEANKVVFAAATFQDRTLTWWNSQVATSRIEAVTRKMWAEMKNVKCNRCGMQHYGNCSIKCNKCGKIGHKARDCWSKVVVTGANAQPVVKCYGCRQKGHIKTNCPTRNNPGRNEARGQAYALRDGDQNLGPNVVTRVLFDSGSDKSFVNINFSRLIDIKPVKVNHSYEVELADGRVVSTNTILRGYALNLVNHLFEIDHMPIELVSCMKFKKYVDRGSYLFVAKVVEKEPTERRLEDVPVICKFPDVFP